MSLLEKLKPLATSSQESPRSVPVWKGPEADGVTQGLLGRYFVDLERFRLLVIEGLKPAEAFNHRLEYGHLWHICEEALAAGAPTRSPGWPEALLNYAQQLARRYPTQQQQVDHWYQVCKVQFPIYVDWWAKHPDVTDRRPLLQEQVFNVPYRLASGRTVRLRGKWDSVDLISKEGVYLQENKTKGEINEAQLKRQLTFDLQTMVYLIALDEYTKKAECGVPLATAAAGGRGIAGVRYNVVRRPLSGGAGSIRQHKPTKSNPRGETGPQFYGRLVGIIRDDPAGYFMRWKVEVSPADLLTFQRQCLDPVLENLCDDYEWWNWCVETKTDPYNYSLRSDVFGPGSHFHRARHYRLPYGVYNPIAEGGSSDLDEYLRSGSEIGLQRTTNLFPELS